jgi:hypothetical protein
MSKRKRDGDGDEEMQQHMKRLRLNDDNNEIFLFNSTQLEKKDCFYPEDQRICDAASRLVHGGFITYVNALKDIDTTNRDAMKTALRDWTNLPTVQEFCDETNEELYHAKTAIMFVRQYFVQTHIKFCQHPFGFSCNSQFTWNQIVPYIRFYIEHDSYCVCV